MSFITQYFNTESPVILNKTLLWDFGDRPVDLTKHRQIIIQRVIEYGTVEDWHFIYDNYGEPIIIDTIKELGTLNKKDLNFVCQLYNLDKNDLKCCRKHAWRVQHWD